MQYNVYNIKLLNSPKHPRSIIFTVCWRDVFPIEIQYVQWGITGSPASPGSPLGPAWLLSRPLVPFRHKMMIRDVTFSILVTFKHTNTKSI